MVLVTGFGAEFLAEGVGVHREVAGCNLCFRVGRCYVLDAALVQWLASEDIENLTKLLETVRCAGLMEILLGGNIIMSGPAQFLETESGAEQVVGSSLHKCLARLEEV